MCYPIFLHRECELTSLVVLQVHKQMLQGEVSVTMCRVREKFWVPKLRSLTKKVIRDWKNIWATGKWLFTLKKDHNFASYIGALNKSWKFNLAQAPWWGGFFKRLIGHDLEKGTFKGRWPKPSDLSRAGRYLDWHRELYEPSTTTLSGRGTLSTPYQGSRSNPYQDSIQDSRSNSYQDSC